MPIDMSAAKAPPKRTRSAAKQPTEIIVPKSIRDKRQEGLEGLGQLAQGGLLLGKQYADAAAIGMHWGPIASELATLADSNDAIAKPIDMLIQVGPYGALVQAVLPLALQLMANHKMIDASGMAGSSVVPPEALEAQMKTQLMQIQMQAQREQAEAQRELAEMQKMQAEWEAQSAAPKDAE